MNVHTIDTQFQGLNTTIATYLLLGSDRPILIDPGPSTVTPILLDELRQLGLNSADISHVLVTHIHLDHAGSAGWWAQQGAKVGVHHVGAPHLIDPSRLLRSAARIYGDMMDMLWGQMLHISPQQILPLHDGDTIEVGDIRLTAWNMPGHARHHHVYVCQNVAFTGDVAGVRMPGSKLISLPAPPPEFDLRTWLHSLEQLDSADFSCIYPTHFGRFDDVKNHFASLRTLLLDSAEFVRRQMATGADRDAILAAYTDWNRDRADLAAISTTEYQQYETANPLFMSVDGLIRYWNKHATLD